MDPVVVFTLEGQRIGLPLGAVDRVVRVVDVPPLPKAPPIVRGLVNVQGVILPVVDTRKRFGMSDRDIALTDQLLIAHTSARTLAMWVDMVTGVVACSDRDFVAAADVVPGMEYIKGIVRLADGMILVHDLDTFLSLEEARALDEVIGNG